MDEQKMFLNTQAPFSVQATASTPQRGQKRMRTGHFMAETTPQVSRSSAFWRDQPYTVGMQDQNPGGLPRAEMPVKSEEVEPRSTRAAAEDAIDVEALVPLSTGRNVLRGDEEYFEIRSTYAKCVETLAHHTADSKLAKSLTDAAMLARLLQDPVTLQERHEGSVSSAWKRMAERAVDLLAAEVVEAEGLRKKFPRKEEQDEFVERIARTRRARHLEAEHQRMTMEVIMKDLDGYLTRLTSGIE